MSEDTGELSEVGRLIENARRARVPKLSQRKAARLTGISDTRWRQLVRSYQLINGQRVGDPGPADTLARMAQVAGVDPDDLRRAGRPDAADLLAAMAAIEEERAGPLDRLVAIRGELDSVIADLRAGR